jgi:23S rRNA (adenine1618-N6)-methyltransferase
MRLLPSIAAAAANQLKKMHPRNKHNAGYDLSFLSSVDQTPELKACIIANKVGRQSVDFSNPHSVKVLNRSLLKAYYNVLHWDIPEGYLAPGVPGRADYIHHIADLLGSSANTGVSGAIGLDIGTGANCIYPLVGVSEYRWKFVGSEIDPVAVQSARDIIQKNGLQEAVEVRLQTKPGLIFNSVLEDNESFDFCMANPPFHSSAAEAAMQSSRKWKNLGRTNQLVRPPTTVDRNKTNKDRRNSIPNLNFGGRGAELYCDGGELAFVMKIVNESQSLQSRIKWFTSLVSKQENIPVLTKALYASRGIKTVKVIDMEQGNKISRILAWSYVA